MSPQALRKAAILVASLEPEAAERVLDLLGDAQARLVREALIRLPAIEPSEQQQIIEEFLRVGPWDGAGAEPVPPAPTGVELGGSLAAWQPAPQPEAAEPDAVVDPSAAPFDFLHTAHSQHVAPFLSQEHPQTIALVVSHLAPERAAEILARLPADVQLEVVARLVDLDEAHPEMVRAVERGLESRLSVQSQRLQRRSAGVARVMSILAASDRALADRIVGNLQYFDPDLADALAPRTWSFDDVLRLDNASLAALLAAAPHELVVLALAGSNEGFTHRVLALFGPRDAAALEQQLATLGPTRLSDVETAQHELAELWGRLHATGRRNPPAPQGSLAA
ncbi:MAG: hypothetical protein K1X74_22880 [Pirellulales bacterium]|nr:hypothetical protein [Pirellulales bacterium]